MTKRLFFLLGLIVGVLFTVIGYRKHTDRLKELEAEKAEEKARYAAYAREWDAERAVMPFERRMDWELFQASLSLDNGIPSWTDGEDDDEQA